MSTEALEDNLDQFDFICKKSILKFILFTQIWKIWDASKVLSGNKARKR